MQLNILLVYGCDARINVSWPERDGSVRQFSDIGPAQGLVKIYAVILFWPLSKIPPFLN